MCQCLVSIPFKRETISKGKFRRWDQSQPSPFQFPSNGKPYPKTLCDLSQKTGRCFNSLQTGNHIQSRTYLNGIPGSDLVSIPFKRETISKVSRRISLMVVQGCVSIPFKRETISKALILVPKKGKSLCFNSLQTGNHIQSF